MIDIYGIRRITDERGVVWEVWEAHPRLVDRRLARDRRMMPRPATYDRRVSSGDTRPALADADGWLVFKSAREERRRTPIPTSWVSMPDLLLLEVLTQSRGTAPFPRARRATT